MHECEDCQYNWSSQHTVHPNRCTVSLWGGVTNLWEYRDNKCHCPNLLQCIYKDLKRTVSQSVNQSSHTLTSGCIYNTFMLCNTKTQEMQGPELCFGLQLYWFSSPLHWSFLLMGCRGHWCFPFHFLVLVFWLVHQVVDFQMSLVLQTSSGN